MQEKYIDIAGHQVYCYEWDNNGEAVVLLHGGLSQTSHWDAEVLPAVEDQFHPFAYDRTAHGFTGDRVGSLHFDAQLVRLGEQRVPVMSKCLQQALFPDPAAANP